MDSVHGRGGGEEPPDRPAVAQHTRVRPTQRRDGDRRRQSSRDVRREGERGRRGQAPQGRPELRRGDPRGDRRPGDGVRRRLREPRPERLR